MFPWLKQKKLLLSLPLSFNLKLIISISIILLLSAISIHHSIKKNKPSSVLSSEQEYNKLIDTILSIKDEVKELSIVIPNIIFSSTREDLISYLDKYKSNFDTVKQHMISLHMNSGESIKVLSEDEREHFYTAYQLLNNNIKEIYSAMYHIKNAPDFEDISEYMDNIKLSINILNHFPNFYKKDININQNLKNFSFKKP